ncbi:MAG TPA: amidase [Chitinophagales bacterium]|nr:amidase [Chitinophagales bacterium]
MKFEEYRKHDATGLAELIKNKEVTPDELLTLAINRAEEVNPKINAVVNKLYDLGKAQLKTVDTSAPFGGVPYLIKDLGPQLKGTRYTCGSRILKDFISTENSVVTDRMLKAGLVIFGKTNTPEFGLTPWTESELFGPAHNPWNLEHTTGGSSGGSGAAVAAGIVPMASANDGGGSIRIPASCNGLFAIKPSRGRVTLGPYFGEGWGGAVCEGIVSRSVRDSALYYDLIHGASEGDPYTISPPEHPFMHEITRPTGKLKIGYSTKMPAGMSKPIDEENINAINITVKLLRDLGHEVVEVELPYKKEMLTELLYAMVYGETSATLDYIGEQRGKKPHRSEVEPNTWLLYKLGKSFSANAFALAKLKWNEVNRKLAEFHRTYDLLLTPTLGMRPFKIGAMNNPPMEENALRVLNALGISSVIRYTGMIEKIAEQTFSWIPYAPLANITGQPSMTVPLHWSRLENTPVGVMFTGRWQDEATLFRLGAQLEKAQPWFDKVPSI